MNGEISLVDFRLKNLNHILTERFLIPSTFVPWRAERETYLNVEPFSPTHEFSGIDFRLNDGETESKPQPKPILLVMHFPIAMFGMMLLQELLEMLCDESK